MVSTDEDRQWIEEATGGAVSRFERTTIGRSRATWLVDVAAADGSTRHLVLRRDTGDGPLSGTELSLEREARVYSALGATAVRAPRLEGVSPDGKALLVERVEGTEDLAGLDPDGRDKVLLDFVDSFADLHLVPVGELELPGFSRPRDAADHALADLSIWTRIFDSEVARPAPLISLALRWLGENPPEVVDRTVLCHGDLGPGNFLHADGRVTALLDWEFAHLGDPHDDLAWLSIRASQVAGLSTIAPLVARYADRTGFVVDPDRAAYYQIMVLVRMAVACLVALERRGPTMDASTYFALLPLLERQITSALAARLQVGLTPTDPPVSSGRSPRSEVIDTISSDVANVYAPDLQSEASQSRLLGTFLLLSHLSAAEEFAETVRDSELDDLAALLGSRPASISVGRGDLGRLIKGATSPHYEDLLKHFSRQADRQLVLWPAVAPMAARPMLEVALP